MGVKRPGQQMEYRAAIVAFLLGRDGSNCRRCGTQLGDDVSVDHIVPVAQGGQHTLANFQLMHLHCNQAGSFAAATAEGRERHRQKTLAHLRGLKRTAEQRLRMAESRKAAWRRPDYRVAVVAGIRRAWAAKQLEVH